MKSYLLKFLFLCLPKCDKVSYSCISGIPEIKQLEGDFKMLNLKIKDKDKLCEVIFYSDNCEAR